MSPLNQQSQMDTGQLLTIVDAFFLSIAPIVQENTSPSNAMFRPVVDRAFVIRVWPNYVTGFGLVVSKQGAHRESKWKRLTLL
jgi:hypothetical protein